MRRPVLLVVCAVVCGVAAPAFAATPSPSPTAPPPDQVVFTGQGSAHGLGMAMDGVEGEARAGWSYDRIMSLFYPGTQVGHTSGTIRVWLAEGGAQRLVLPGGGTVAGLPVRAGGGVTVTTAPAGKLAVAFDAPPVTPKATPSPTPAAKPTRPVPDSVQVPAPPPAPLPTPTPAPPRPKPTPGAPAPTAAPAAATVNVPSPLIVAPQGTPAITTVVTTGRRYRGTIELRRTASGVRVINHVSLEDYVAGIAEEKGAGWPLEGMKALAVAARTLGAATMTWLGAHHADGYDICPTDNCQVYLGYDGEEAIMREAVDETAGEIRMYNGSPILAMYHGNGGGQTQSYKDLTNDAGDPYPYLVSVKYPFADPWHWTVKTTLHDVADALSKDGVTNVPSPLKYVIVLKRGETPRVKRVGLFDDTPKGIALNGAAFAHALGLPSNWFYVHLPHKPPRSYDAAFIGQIDTGPPDLPVPAQRAEPWALRLLAGALAAAAALSGWTANGGPATAWKRARRVARIPRRLSAAPDVL